MAANKKQVSYHMRIADCIPDELLLEILLRLPAQDIYFEARLVCRKWCHMIRTKYFIHKHLEHAGYGLLYLDSYENLVFTSLREDGGGIVDTYKLNYKNRYAVRSSWNGLILQDEPTDKGFIYRVTNLLSCQRCCLPPCPHSYCCYLGGMGYDATSTTYKVVVPYMEKTEKCGGCAILTIGVDKSWRIVPTDLLSSCGKRTIMTYPIITEGFVHWHRVYGTKIVTLNLETEIIVEIPLPQVEGFRRSWCLATGRYLSLFVWCKPWTWEVYEMKPEIGEWRKFANIYMKGQHGRIKKLGYEPACIEPFGWLKYPEVLALVVNRVVIFFYNFTTCEIGAETLSISYGTRVTLHKNSLVWFDVL